LAEFVIIEGLWHPQHWRKLKKFDALKKELATEINGMTKKIEDLEAMMKFMLKQQNLDLDESDIEEMMAWALSNESSAIAPCSFVATHVPNDDEFHIWTI